VFKLRQEKRSESDQRRHEARRGLDEIVNELDALGRAADKSDEEIRRQMRQLQERWRAQPASADAAWRSAESRYRHALSGIEALLRSRARSRQAAEWDTLSQKERMCEQLERKVLQVAEQAQPASAEGEALQVQWNALPKLGAACEQKMNARRDAALRALEDERAAADYAGQIERSGAQRQEGLLALELLLGLDTPAELQAERLALQVKQLRDRFQKAVDPGAENAGERLCDWCAKPGVLEPRERSRAERVFTAVSRRR
jgi:hypothetical protein